MIYEYRASASGEGANIRAWIGFKHFEYLVSDAVRALLGSRGLDVRQLTIDGGGVDIVASRVSLTSVIELDDPLTVRIVSASAGAAGGLVIAVEVHNGRSDRISLKGRYHVAIHPAPRHQERIAALVGSLPAHRPSAADRPRPGTLGVDEPSRQVFGLGWTVPYYYCERSAALCHRGQVRAVETVVDAYLRAAGLAIPDLLADRGWIPVVSRYSFETLAQVPMGARVRTQFRVDEVVGDLMFNGSWALYQERSEGWRCAARGEIQHGYAISRGEDAGSLARLDEATGKALLAGGPRSGAGVDR